jgi:hypothetical protein
VIGVFHFNRAIVAPARLSSLSRLALAKRIIDGEYFKS